MKMRRVNNLRAMTSVAALAVALGLGAPSAAFAQGVPDILGDPDGMWFISIEGDFLMLSVPDEVSTFGQEHSNGDSFQSKFNNSFNGGLEIGRKAGRWDTSISVRGSMFSADEVSIIPDDIGNSVDIPYQTDITTTTEAFALGNDSAAVITGDWVTGYTLPSDAGAPKVRLFGGLKVEQFNWNRDATFDSSSDGSDEVSEASSFLGIGPSIGIGVEIPVNAEGTFVLFGSASGGVLLGRLSRTVEFVASSEFNDANESSLAAVPFASLEAGVTLRIEDNIDFSLGYQADLRENVIRNGTADSNGSDVVQNQAFTQGLFARLTAYFE